MCGFTYHELPAEAAAAVAAEARRVCRPGGVFTVIDLSPKCACVTWHCCPCCLVVLWCSEAPVCSCKGDPCLPLPLNQLVKLTGTRACRSGVYKEKNPLAVLRNIVEPWHDAYFATDLQDVLEQAGFTDVTTVVVSPRHHAVMGRAL